MSELEKRYIVEALKKKYEEMQIENERSMNEEHLDGSEGSPVMH